MSRVLVVSLALVAAACVTRSPSTGFVETILALEADGLITAETAQEVIEAYRAAIAAPTWWEPLLEQTWQLALGAIGAILWIRYGPQALGGRGAPEKVRARRASP